ncbi:MAG: hypothetical protein GYB33_07460 [Gammaproteobacteria bacterium]|uniref:hypothetical protein n=1 Tax=Pseudomaricurvus alcaniphilus TaxID=1166482 RepID=UPI001409E34B|nr:hypothetical protein [Pseudomaricurvus alcaniphilus]MBR9910173.1 hypothetical protein [Gammaproteobacteria bacterium]NHN36690.1 hypothetical protein [Pseudomaricurvus alcaniphilus]
MQSLAKKSVNLCPGIHLTTFGKETILFHEGTGDTVLLHPYAASLVYLLQASNAAVAVGDLIRSLASEQDFDLDDEFSSHATSLLMELLRQDVIYLQ